MSVFDHSITETLTTTGRTVQAKYLNNANYDPQSNVCACLHWVFLLYSPSRNPARAYLLRDAIDLFLDFRHVHNSNNPELLHINMYTDINSEIFYRYIEYVRDLGDTPAKPEILKSAIKLVAEETGNRRAQRGACSYAFFPHHARSQRRLLVEDHPLEDSCQS
ncbi:hypothetical protein [Pseudomonas coronafaciens]|uniref:hypothetical protein n=1 Tax=Pseudomonas coronafaciens TaxID=53409 RepID=UPI0037910A7E